MISSILATTTSAPIANIQHNTESQGVLNTQNAATQFREEERQVRESVVQKDEAVFYQPNHDAKEEGRNKYANLYNNKKKKTSEDESEEKNINRQNFDILI